MENVLLGALEAGGTKMVCATGYADGTVVEQVSMPTTTPAETMEEVAAWFADKSVAALGVGAFGPTAVNPASPRFGQILETPKTAWRYFDMLGSVRDRLKIPCGYDTDVNVACLGEVTFGCARGLTDVVYLTIGGGVADHTPIVALSRAKCAEWLNGYLVTPEMANLDTYIVNNSLEGKQGIMGCLELARQALVR